MLIQDQIDPQPSVEAHVIHNGRVFDLVSESIDLGEAGVVTREYIDHPGAVAVIALDDQERVLLLRQYRAPVRAYLWEPPAGLLDIPGEDTQIGAARELYEEADLRAEHWHVLTDYLTTPGGNNEAIRVFLARGLTQVPDHERHAREDEELNMQQQWVSIDEAVELVLSGNIHNPSAVVGILAVNAARARNWETLRSVDAPFPYRRETQIADRVADRSA